MQLYGNAVFVSAEELSLINSIFPQSYLNVDLQIFLVNVVRAFSNVESWGNLISFWQSDRKWPCDFVHSLLEKKFFW